MCYKRGMKKSKYTHLAVHSQTLRILSEAKLAHVAGGWQDASGSQGSYSGPCPPLKNGEGSGCVTG